MGLPPPLGYSFHSLNLFCTLPTVGFYIIIQLDTLVLIHSKHAGRVYNSFCVRYWFVFDYTLIFQSLNFTTLILSVSGLFWYTVDTSVSLQSDVFLEIQQLSYSLLLTQLGAVCQVMSLWERPIFMQVYMHNFANCVMSFRVPCLMFTILQLF